MRALLLILLLLTGCYDVRPALDSDDVAWRVNRVTGDVCRYNYSSYHEPHRMVKDCRGWVETLGD